MLISNQDWQHLETRGWVVFQTKKFSSILELGKQLGQLTPSLINGRLLDILEPRTFEDARPRSMSARFGMGIFPYHTDCAHFRNPPRFVILRCKKSSRVCPTMICEMNALNEINIMQPLRRAVWVVNGGRGRFYASAISTTSSGERMVRFDSCCMRPASASFENALSLMNKVIEASTKVSIDWEPSLTLILDNWKVLHARADASASSEKRILERVLIST